jgi:hypothetical protein
MTSRRFVARRFDLGLALTTYTEVVTHHTRVTTPREKKSWRVRDCTICEQALFRDENGRHAAETVVVPSTRIVVGRTNA